MDELDALLARYGAGERISFGAHVALERGFLDLPGAHLPLNTLETLRLDADGNAIVRRLGWDEPPIVVQAAEVADVDLLVQVTNALIAAIPYLQRRSSTGWPPGSIGDVSARIGYDVRDLLVAGYTDDQIRGLLRKEYTLDELFKQRPKGPPMKLRRKGP
jgi:hypothetical protein